MPSGDEDYYVGDDDYYVGDGDDVDGEEVCLDDEFCFRSYIWPFMILYLLSGLGK